jgi:hypothetical protein
MTERADQRARRVLSKPPITPDDPSRFSSDSDTCGPGLYPQGPPMVPASGPDPDVATLATVLNAYAGALGAPDAARRFDDPALIELAPDAPIRVGLCLLLGTVAAPVVDAVLASPDITSIRYGQPVGAGRIAGPSGVAGERAVNVRYHHEHPALLAGALAHEILHTDPPRSDPEETWLHAVLAFIHVQLLAAVPSLAELRTELGRRMASFAISLVCSRSPGDPTFRLVAPDGRGTIPGGAPGMQTPDFWSIPFLPDRPGPAPMPDPMLAILSALTDGLEPPGDAAYDEATARWLDDHLGDRWLRWSCRLTAARALGVAPG